MKKKWRKSYLLLGLLIFLVLALIGNFAFINNTINQFESKHTFESIYIDSKIDFIIPSPSSTQVEDIGSKNGIAKISPYYETTTALYCNDVQQKGTTILIPRSTGVEGTPYCSSRIIRGAIGQNGSFAIIDKKYAEKNDLVIGDLLSITIQGERFDFEITGISEENTYCNEGSTALIMDSDVEQFFAEKGITYSAAYVEASNHEVCKNFLLQEYKPLGRLKNQSEFDNIEAYEQHVKNFNDADWSKEITDCHSNYDMLSVKYNNVESTAWINTGIYSTLIFIATIVYFTVLLKSEENNKYFRECIVKKSVTKEDVIGFYRSGIVTDIVLFVIMSAGLFVALMFTNNVSLPIKYIPFGVVPVMVSIVASLIMIAASKKYVNNHYKVKPQKQSN